MVHINPCKADFIYIIFTDNLSVDPYFTHYNPSNEHGEFSEALERLDKKHTEQMTKVSQQARMEWLDKNHTEQMTKVRQQARMEWLDEKHTEQMTKVKQQDKVERLNKKHTVQMAMVKHHHKL
jgi:hypothetical protein